jgi:uncharacterized damage-inducible protein DinB
MPTLTSILTTQMVRELETFIREIEAFPSDDSVWHTRRGVTNSAGNLALHVCGNLQDFVGRVLGGTSFVRHRDQEFGQREGTRASLVAELRTTIAVIESTLPVLTDETIAADYPMPLAGKTLNTATFLVHLGAHLAFHLGQAGYLRRVITGENTTTNPLPLAAIAAP